MDSGPRVVDKAFRVLEYLARENEPRSASQIAKALGLPWSTAFRLIAHLERRGYLVRDRATRYRLGIKLWEIGAAAVSGLDLRKVARPVMEELALKTGETINLGVLGGSEIVYIDRIESVQPVRIHAPIGFRAPVHCVAIGKAILAFQPWDSVLRVLPRRLRKYTRSTITSRSALRKELERVRRRGYATSDQEWLQEVCGLASAIRDYKDEGIGAIGMSIPISRYGEGRLALLAGPLCEATETVSKQLGLALPAPPVDYRRGPADWRNPS